MNSTLKVRLGLFFLALLAVVFMGGTSGVPETGAASFASITGEINTVDLDAGTINIKKTDGSSLTLRTVGLTRITRNGIASGLADLALRDSVTVKYFAPKSLALRVTATGPILSTVAGAVAEVSPGSGLLQVGSVTVGIGAGAKIARNGLVVSLSSITARDTVVVHVAATASLAAEKAQDVVANGPDQDEVHGLISAISGSSVTVAPANGSEPLTVTVGATTTIEVDGEPAVLGDLAVGQQVEIHYDPATLVANVIEANSEGEQDDARVKGIVAAVDVDAGTITITPDGGAADITLTVGAAAEIEVNGEEASLAEVVAGMPVKAEYNSVTLAAAEIKAGSDKDRDENDGDAQLNGLVAAVGTDSVTITPDGGGADVTLTVDAGTKIEVNGEKGTLAEIQPGQPIEAEYYLDTNVAKELKAGIDDGDNDGEEDAETSGTVSAVGTNTITIAPANGSPALTLTVTSSTEIEVDGEQATIADIQVGDPIHAEYYIDTLVAGELKAGVDDEEEAETTGTVTAVTDTTVTIAPDNGSAAVTLIVTSETDIEVDGEDGTIADIQVGEPIRAKYDPVTLTAQELRVGSGGGNDDDSEVEGTVAALGADSITITPAGGGADITLSVNPSTKIEVNGHEAGLADIQVGAPVRAEYVTATLVATEIDAGISGVGDRDEVRGSVAAVSSTSITIAPVGGGANVILAINAATDIEIDGDNAAVEDILVGDKARVQYEIKTLLAIDIEIDRD